MPTMICPKCQGEMQKHRRAGAEIAQCDDCGGVFLDRIDLGALVEAEQDWHESHRGHHTQQLPRITDDMEKPSYSDKPASRGFVDKLFGA